MSTITTGAVHHLVLTVSDVARSQTFYIDLLGFEHLTDFGPRVLLSNGSLILALTPPPDPAQAVEGDRSTRTASVWITSVSAWAVRLIWKPPSNFWISTMSPTARLPIWPPSR